STTNDVVGAFATDQGVVAVATLQDVAACATVQGICTIATGQDVTSAGANDAQSSRSTELGSVERSRSVDGDGGDISGINGHAGQVNSGQIQVVDGDGAGTS